MFERKILISNQLPHNLLDSTRVLLSHSLESYNWNVGILDVSPDQVPPIWHHSARFISSKNSLEAVEVRQKNDTVEIIAQNCNFAGSSYRRRKRRKLRYDELLTEFLSESFSGCQTSLRIATFGKQISLKSRERGIELIR